MKIREQNQSFKKQLLLQNSNKQQIKLKFQNIHLSNKPYALKENRTNTETIPNNQDTPILSIATAPSHSQSPYVLSQFEPGNAKISKKQSKIKISSTNLPRQQANIIKNPSQSYQNLQLSRISRSSKIENRKQQESERGMMKFCIEGKGVEIIELQLEKASNQEHISREKIIQLLQILKRYKKVFKINEQQEVSKPKFRIVKSGKKNQSLREEKQDEDPGSSLKIQQKSSIQDKIEYTQQSNDRQYYEPMASGKKLISPISSPSIIKKQQWKLKIKKGGTKKQDYQELAASQVRAVTSEEIINRMKIQQKSLLKKYQERQLQLKEKNQHHKLLQKQIQQLKQKSQIEQNIVIIKDFKFSLKVITDEMKSSNQCFYGHNQEKDKKIQKDNENELEHLKLIIVAQNKQIQRAHQKIVLLQKVRIEQATKKKQSRWQCEGFQD